MFLESGIVVDITVKMPSGKADVRKAKVYRADEKWIVLSQTMPPLSDSFIKSSIIFSYISASDSMPVRIGYSGKISDIVSRYPILSTQYVPAIIIEDLRKLEGVTLRRSTRVRPGNNCGMSLIVRGRRAKICDISMNGINFMQPGSRNVLSPGDVFDFIMTAEDTIVELKAKVIRTSEKDDMQFTAADFMNMESDAEDILGMKLFVIEMQCMQG
jgi:hypothetical protein